MASIENWLEAVVIPPEDVSRGIEWGGSVFRPPVLRAGAGRGAVSD